MQDQMTQQEMVAEWDAYSDAICEAIKAGMLDKHLRKIARTAYTRGRTIEPREEKPSTGSKTPISDRAAAIDPDFPVARVQTGDLRDDDVRHGDSRYRRVDLIGKTFTIRPGTFKNDSYVGLKATITGAGEKALKVRFSNPNGIRIPGPDAMKDEGFIYIRRVPYLFN